MVNPSVLIHAEPLSDFGESILRAIGVSKSKARLVATSLVASNLRGVDSHGLQLLPFYVAQLESGDASKTADGRV
jgi:LDH2 family malate/lactate/ureidoglycolate dehydrogenase